MLPGYTCCIRLYFVLCNAKGKIIRCYIHAVAVFLPGCLTGPWAESDHSTCRGRCKKRSEWHHVDQGSCHGGFVRRRTQLWPFPTFCGKSYTTLSRLATADTPARNQHQIALALPFIFRSGTRNTARSLSSNSRIPTCSQNIYTNTGVQRSSRPDKCKDPANGDF